MGFYAITGFNISQVRISLSLLNQDAELIRFAGKEHLAENLE
jgi:hypothetical protein